MLKGVAPVGYGIPHPAKSIDFQGGRPGEGSGVDWPRRPCLCRPMIDSAGGGYELSMILFLQEM